MNPWSRKCIFLGVYQGSYISQSCIYLLPAYYSLHIWEWVGWPLWETLWKHWLLFQSCSSEEKCSFNKLKFPSIMLVALTKKKQPFTLVLKNRYHLKTQGAQTGATCNRDIKENRYREERRNVSGGRGGTDVKWMYKTRAWKQRRVQVSERESLHASANVMP